MNVRFPRISSLLLAAFLAVSSAAAQEAQMPENEPPAGERLLSVEELRARLDQLKKELAEEQAALVEREKRHAEELEKLQQTRTALADQILEGRVESLRNADEIETLKDRLEQSRTKAAELAGQAERIPSAIREAAEQLRLHYDELPGGSVKSERLQLLADEAAWSTQSPPDAEAAATIQSILEELDQAHDAASKVTVRTESIHTADGHREAVKLLAIGHARFVYETVEEGRIGIALSSPQDASGFRWSETLDENSRRWAREAIAAVEAGRKGVISPPIDPTGRLQPASLVKENGLTDQFRAGGPVMYPLAGIAVVALLLVLERVAVLFFGNRNPERVVREALADCRAGRIEQAMIRCENAPGTVCRVLAACLRRYPFGVRAMEDGIQEQLLHEQPRLQRSQHGLAVLATVAPLLGLLGTVTGIIDTFGVIRAFGNANPALMAGGISEALITTAAGLIIAVPILIIHGVLRGRADGILADAERHAATLLMTLWHQPSSSEPAGNGETSAELSKSEVQA